MHCWSACVSSAGALCLECRNALFNYWSTVAPKHVLPERHLRLPERIVSIIAPFETTLSPKHVLPEHLLILSKHCVFSAGAPYAIVGALWLQSMQLWSAFRTAGAPLGLPERIVSRTLTVGAEACAKVGG
ncbi:hypothetical protein AMTR_s00007p00245670 [Amborella trichopoda]|uniref:Uncharacterized protein n=1 Tax=Amborella trichopoda TaxID=13333 RepID=W1PBX8_AMBTC|nr:hypothetical protein AMTR_s00007p00245670 [Amborella trichopoda]